MVCVRYMAANTYNTYVLHFIYSHSAIHIGGILYILFTYQIYYILIIN